MADSAKEVLVINNEATSRMEAQVSGHTAFIEYRRSGTTITFVHTYVPPALEGHGIGGKLARAGLEFARSAGLKVVVVCPFVMSYIRRHSEYSELIQPEPPNRIE